MAEPLLTPARCRWLSGSQPATLNFVDARGVCSPEFHIPMDPHCAAAVQTQPRYASAGSPTVLRLVRLLHGRRVAFVGDSISGQVANGLECSLRRTRAFVGELQHTSLTRSAPELATACDELWRAVGLQTVSRTAYENSQCRALGAGTSASVARELNATWMTLQGTHLKALNFTFFRRFGDGYHYRQRYSTHAGTQSTTLVLPSHLELIRRHDLADVVVFNFGLHSGEPEAYRRTMSEAIDELDAFGAMPGKVALLRETSAQHFGVPSGDYWDAIRKDPTLVLAPKERDAALSGAASSGRHSGRQRSVGPGADLPPSRQSVRGEWTGPSMCTRSDERTSVHWRNAVVHELLKARRPKHVQLVGFEALTRQRWEYHSTTAWRGNTWKSDCTHFCYSPCMWDLHWLDMVRALQRARDERDVAHGHA